MNFNEIKISVLTVAQFSIFMWFTMIMQIGAGFFLFFRRLLLLSLRKRLPIIARFLYIMLLSFSAISSVISPALQAKPVLTVYTYAAFAGSFGPGRKIKKVFEQQCNCTLNWLVLPSGIALLNRLKLEGPQTKADVVLGLDATLLSSAVKTDLFMPLNIDRSRLSLPVAWSNRYFLPYNYGYLSFIYNKKRLPKPPEDFSALIENQQLTIIYPDPRFSALGFSFLLWMKRVFGEQTDAAWRKLAIKRGIVTKSWSEGYHLFLRGEGDMVLSFSTSPAFELTKDASSEYAAAHFSEGHYFYVEAVGKIKSSRQPQLAAQFIEFVLTDSFQKAVASENWLYPVINNIELPPAFQLLWTPQKILFFDAESVSANRHQWLKKWQAVVTSNSP